MKTNKKQIKKELKKTLNLLSKVKKSKIKNHQDSMMALYNEVNGIKNVVKMILEQKTKKEEKDLVEA
jgi:hypothetical protein